MRTKYDLKRLCTIPVENGIEEVQDGAAENGEEDQFKQQKGCDIGYALATCSREGADSVDARTVTALRGDRRFRSAESNYSLRRRRFRLLNKLPCQANHSAYFGSAKFYLSQTFSAIDASQTK